MDKILVTRSSMPPMEEYIEEIKLLWETHWLTNMGEKHLTLEKMMQDYLGVDHTILYTNGHLALENVIAAFDFPKGSEVITTPFTFASTTHAIVRNELIPIFCDINEDDYTIDVFKIEELITEKTVAILPVHVYGNVCNIEEIERIATKYNLKVIYDAAHAFGVKYNGASVANFGDVVMFSFHATKVFNTIEGGALCFNGQTELVQILNDMKNFGIHDEETVAYVGGNAKMNEFQAAMGICNLRHINEEIEKRKKVVECYRENLSDREGIKLCKESKNVISNYAYMPIVFRQYKYSRDEVYKKLAEKEIYARKYFYPLTNTYECYGNYILRNERHTKIAKEISDNVLTLPLYSDLKLEEVDRICDIICK